MIAVRGLGVVSVVLALAGAAVSARQGATRPRAESFGPLRRDSASGRDAIARLQARINAGDVVLARDSAFGYLPSLLRALEIPVSSQGLVFSRTSLQTDKIAPWSPRAIYFNDDVYIGYVQESHFLEIGAVDPVAGAVFYTLSQEPAARPSFSRETTTCLMCHQSRAATGGVPGFMVLSTISDRHGYPIVGVHEGTTTDVTPVRQRFGGWYVTGTHGTSGHAGNVYSPLLGHEVSDKQAYRGKVNMSTESARTELADKFDASPYLSGHSDVVALMVLVHQTIVHNLVTSAHETAKDVERFGTPVGDSATLARARAEATGPNARMTAAVDRLLRAMLFIDAAPLDGPMQGTTAFAKEFPRSGPRDRQGRSLRDFDLSRRLFAYPLSFLIYSESFDALPMPAKREFYARLWEILHGTDPHPDFRQISADDRRAILEILDATKPEFATLRNR